MLSAVVIHRIYSDLLDERATSPTQGVRVKRATSTQKLGSVA